MAPFVHSLKIKKGRHINRASCNCWSAGTIHWSAVSSQLNAAMVLKVAGGSSGPLQKT